jgi:hypothetical protein
MVELFGHINYFTLDPKGGWIHFRRASGGLRRVCWLPHERCSGGKIVNSGKRVCIGGATGVVTILDFSHVNDEHYVFDG